MAEQLGNAQAATTTTGTTSGATPATAPSPAGGSGAARVHAMLARGEHVPARLADAIRDRPGELHEVAALLHRTLGNGVVQAVMTELGRAPASHATPAAAPALPVAAKLDLATMRSGEVRDAEEANALAPLSGSVGAPLSAELISRFGATLGHDLSHVAIHTDAPAAAAAAHIGARAFAIGSSIYFAAGAYAPGSAAGDRLLLHELTHVVQHDRGSLAAVPAGQSRVSDPSDAHEQEASAMEARADETATTMETRPTTSRAPAAERAPVSRAVHGVANEGNDCFMNAVLQLLATAYRPLFDPAFNAVGAHLRRLQRVLHTQLTAMRGNAVPVHQRGDTKTLRMELMIAGVIETYDEQEDAGEVLRKLLGLMLSLGGRTVTIPGKDAPVTLPIYASWHNGQIPCSPAELLGANAPLKAVLDRFTFDRELTQSYALADSAPRVANGDDSGASRFDAQRESKTQDANLSMVPVEMGNHGGLEAFLAERYGRGESIDLGADNALKARDHADHPIAIRKRTEAVAFTRLPDVMTFSVQRFAFGDKVERAFSIPNVLVLKEGAQYCTYQLCAMVRHHGVGIERGHYTAQVDDATDREDDQPSWRTADDAHISARRNEPHKAQAGYLYTYQLRDKSPDHPVDQVVAQDLAPPESIPQTERELVEGEGSGALAKLSAPRTKPRNRGPSYELPVRPAPKSLVRTVEGKEIDLASKTVADIDAAVKLDPRLATDTEVQRYLQVRARKDFYASVHLVYDLDQTLITYLNTTYHPPAFGSRDGHLAEEAKSFPFKIEAVVAKDTNQSTIQPTYRPGATAGTWSQRPAPKTIRQRGETGASVEAQGEASSSPSKDDAKPTRTPSNQEPQPVRAMAIRPGALEALDELDAYGVQQSVWTHNSDHHMHRVLEMFDAKGFGEHRFAGSKAGHIEGSTKKPLAKLDPTATRTTVLLDDQPARENPELGGLADSTLGPFDGRYGELLVPAWDAPKANQKAKPKDGETPSTTAQAQPEPTIEHDLRKLLGDRLMVKLALARTKGEKVDPLALRFLQAIKQVIGAPSISDDAVPAALEKFLAIEGNAALLREGFGPSPHPVAPPRTTPDKTPRPEPTEDPSLYALTPSLGASLLLPPKPVDKTEGDAGESGQEAETEQALKEAALKRYKAANVINRGLVRTELLGDKRCVRVYQVEANALSSAEFDKHEYKDIHEKPTGEVKLAYGKGEVCFSVGTPVRSLKWFEKYQEEHFGKNFNPVVRSFLIPLETYENIARRAIVQEQSSGTRYNDDREQRSTNVDIASETDQYETRESDFKLFQASAVSGSLVSWALDSDRLESGIGGDVRPIRELYAQFGMQPFSGIFTAKDRNNRTCDPFTENGAHRDPSSAGKLAIELAEHHATHLENEDGIDPTASLELRPTGRPIRDNDVRTANLAEFVRSHLYNPPEGKRFALAMKIDRDVRAKLEGDDLAERTAKWEVNKKAAAERRRLAGKPPLTAEEEKKDQPKPKRPQPKDVFDAMKTSEAPEVVQLRSEFAAAQEEYKAYLREHGQPVPTWADDGEFFHQVLSPLAIEGERYHTRMMRIREERVHHEQALRERGAPVPKLSDEEYFLRHLVPNAATQLEITHAISDNTDEARDDLRRRNPGHDKSFEQLWRERETGEVHVTDTAMGTIDFGDRKDENLDLRKKGDVLTETIKLKASADRRADDRSLAAEIVDVLLREVPELAAKFAEESNPGKYTFRQHAERVIGQYLKYFRDGHHALLGLDGVIKMILFHDMDKFRGRRLKDALDGSREQERLKLTGKDKLDERKVVIDPSNEDLAKVVHHTGLSPVAVSERMKARLAREQHDKDSAAEHVLPSMMMERYASLWSSPDEARMAIALMDGDPIGTMVKAATPLGKRGEATRRDQAAIEKARKIAYTEIVEMAQRAGISPHDYAGLAAFYAQLLQFYQADSSSYSTAATHEGETKPDKSDGTFDYIYQRERDEVGAPLVANKETDAKAGTHRGFLAFQDPDVAAAVAELTRMFTDGAKTQVMLEGQERKKQAGGKKKDPTPEADVESEMGYEWFEQLFSATPTPPPDGSAPLTDLDAMLHSADESQGNGDHATS